MRLVARTVAADVDDEEQVIVPEFVDVSALGPPRSIAAPAVEQHEGRPLPDHVITDGDAAIRDLGHPQPPSRSVEREAELSSRASFAQGLPSNKGAVCGVPGAVSPRRWSGKGAQGEPRRPIYQRKRQLASAGEVRLVSPSGIVSCLIGSSLLLAVLLRDELSERSSSKHGVVDGRKRERQVVAARETDPHRRHLRRSGYRSRR